VLPPRDAVWSFSWRFVLLLCVYLFPWRPVGAAYGGAAAALGNLAVGNALHSTVLMRFRSTAPEATDARDAFGVELRAEDTETGSVVRVPIDLRTLAYLPTAVFVSLCIAAPIWNEIRGAIVLLSGLCALQAFLVGSIAVPLLLFLANPTPMHLVELGPVSYRILDVLYRSLVAPPGMAFVVPGGIWLLALWLVPKKDRSADPGPVPAE
jgi:hypothetical protein